MSKKGGKTDKQTKPPFGSGLVAAGYKSFEQCDDEVRKEGLK